MSVGVCVCACVCLSVCVYASARAHARMCVCVCVCVCVCARVSVCGAPVCCGGENTVERREEVAGVVSVPGCDCQSWSGAAIMPTSNVRSVAFSTCSPIYRKRSCAIT